MGYLKKDERASGGSLFETDTTHCRHCQAVIDKRKWREDMGIWKCSACDGPVCHHCTEIAAANNYACDPWQKKIDEQLKKNEQERYLIGIPR